MVRLSDIVKRPVKHRQSEYLKQTQPNKLNTENQNSKQKKSVCLNK